MSNRSKVFQSVVAARPVLSEEHIQVLQQPFTIQEVKDAIFSIPGMKAPGPDGFGSSFYHDNWDLVGEVVGTAVINFLNTGKILKEINTTTITLIPKVKCPDSVKDFRPISCCNVIYKAATKVICSRLRQILPEIIAENQGPETLLFDFWFAAKPEKMVVYCSGMQEAEVTHVLKMSGYTRAHLPFSVYLMDKNWWEYQPPTDCSWYWKRLVAVKEAFKAKADLSYFAALRYSIKIGLDLLFDQPLAVGWSKVVWDRLSIPKHRIVLWLVMLQRL
ncbi:uncharacterized protein LOC133831720 [Humulus lupulus]|uniref:uncharacterized protein LOC133831720 n=1 Tax=Humulus lupulus TaxID=3486 RepID=UPI002B417886|nr:uncharacterized protein LOC133831720 [Humulus lupulus]